METFNKVSCQKLRRDIENLLADYAAKEGLTFKVGNMRFSSSEVRITSFTASINGAQTKVDRELESMIKMNNLQKTNNRGDTLVGYNARRFKYPFTYLGADGRQYKAGLAFIKSLGFTNPALTLGQ